MLKIVRHVKDQEYQRNGKTAKLRQFSVKDCDDERNRLTIFPDCKAQESVEPGMVLVLTHLQTSKFPQQGPPYYIQSTMRTSVRLCPESALHRFEDISDVDKRYLRSFSKFLPSKK